MKVNIKHTEYNESPQQILERALAQCSIDSELNPSVISSGRYCLVLSLAYQILGHMDFIKCFSEASRFGADEEAEDFLLAANDREAKAFKAAQKTLSDLNDAVQSAKMWDNVEKQLDDMFKSDSKK